MDVTLMAAPEPAVVVIAGGEGRRIGGSKPLLKLRGERLIDHALKQAAAWSDRVAVVVRDPAQVGTVNVSVIIDEPDLPGPLGGVVAALRFAKAAACELLLVIPTDMPFLPSDLLDRLSSAIAGDGCALASSGGHLHPVCSLWRTSALNDVHRYLAGEQRSLKAFAALIGFHGVEWPTNPLDPFLNINTFGELDSINRLLATSGRIRQLLR